MNATLLKVITATDPHELERLTNEFCQSRDVYSVVNMRVYPPGGQLENWFCYIVYKQRWESHDA